MLLKANKAGISESGALGILMRSGVLLFLVTPILNAQVTFDWDDGGAGSNWSTGANWDPNGAPPTGLTTTQLDFSTGSSANNDFSSFTLSEITFGAALGSGDFTLTGNTITGDRVNGNSGTQFRLFKNSTGNVTINNNLNIDNTGGNGNLQILGSSSGTLTLNGDILPTGGNGGRLTKFDDFTLILTGDNAFGNGSVFGGGSDQLIFGGAGLSDF